MLTALLPHGGVSLGLGQSNARSPGAAARTALLGSIFQGVIGPTTVSSSISSVAHHQPPSWLKSVLDPPTVQRPRLVALPAWYQGTIKTHGSLSTPSGNSTKFALQLLGSNVDGPSLHSQEFAGVANTGLASIVHKLSLLYS